MTNAPAVPAFNRTGLATDADVVSILVGVASSWRRLLGGAVACSAVAALLLLVAPDYYTTHTTFAPSTSSSALTSIGNVAASLGLGLGDIAENGPKFYADLVTSDAILLQVLDTTQHQYNYYRVSHLSAKDNLRLRDKGLKHLRRHLDVNFDARTSVVTVELATRDPELSVQIAQVLLDALNRFNISTLQTTARSRRQFLEQRLRDARQELSEATDSLKLFYIRNRQYQQSPVLVLREADLRQEYALKQQTVNSLASSLEQARIDEVRDTPVLTVLDTPILPSKPSDPKRALLAIGFGFLWLAGYALWVSTTVVTADLATRRPKEAAAIVGVWSEMRKMLRRREHP